VEDFDGQSITWLPRSFEKVRRVYWGQVWKQLLLGNFVHPPTLMMRSDARARAGWLKEDLRTNEDWEYITRLARLGAIAFVEGPLLKYRRHPNQMSSSASATDAINYIRVLEGHRQLCDAHDVDTLGRIDIRLAQAHAEVTYLLAHSDRRKALWHLRRATSIAPREARIPFHLARMMMPQTVMRMLRKLRSVGNRQGHVRGDRNG
jgi:hypothetical protein